MSDETARRALGEAVRAACLEAATRAYEEAGLAGLCAEGRFDLALDAIRSLDLDGALSSTECEDSKDRGRASQSL